MSKRNRSFLRDHVPSIFIGGVVATMLATTVYFQSRANTSDQASVPAVMATIGTIEKTVTALGSLEPKNYVDVGAQVSGQLKAVNVEVGDRVQEGDLLAEIDPTVYKSRVEADKAKLFELRAQYDLQKAKLELAQIQCERAEKLLALKAASQDSVDTAKTNVTIAKTTLRTIDAQIQQAESTLEEDEANLSYAMILAPMSGTVMSQDVSLGQTINASQSAPTILQIADLDTMTVRAEVAEADIVRIKPGMKAWFTTLGNSSRRWEATVRQVLPSPTIENDVVLYNVLVDVENTDGMLMSGMTAQVFFLEGRAKDVVTLPASAITRQGSGNTATVNVMTPNGIEARKIRTGLSTRTTVEIVSGLEAGETVALGVTASRKSAANVTPPPPPGGLRLGGKR